MASDLSVRRLLRRVAALFRSGKAEAELAREIDAHLLLLEDQFVAQGMTRDDARYAARRAFGGVEQAKERQRDERSFRGLAGWPMDMKLGVRMLTKSPGLTVIAVVALAVAIGAGAAYLEFVTDLIRPSLSIPHAERIVGVRVWDVERRQTEARLLHDFGVWRSSATAFEHLGAQRLLNTPLITADGRVERANGIAISAAAFRVVPVTPRLGRTLLEDDEQPDAPPVVVIGYDLWRTRFNSDPNIVGQTVRLGRDPHTIAGVMPAGFGFPINQELWVPLKVESASLRRGEGAEIQIFGRLKDGVSVEAARTELSAMLSDGESRSRLRVDVRPYLDSLLSGETSRALIERLLYSGNLLFVVLLAICGANVATLVFARTATREAEITVRTALGATRGRICAQLFAEALVLTGIAAVAGLMLAGFVGSWLARTFTAATGQPLPFWWNDNLSLETLVYSIALALFAALIVGVIPALKATGGHLQGRLREAGAGAGGSTMKFGWLWTGVIIVQVAITVIFLAAVASLGWTTYRDRHDRDVTFAREQFLTAVMVPEKPPAGSKEPAYQSAYRTLADKLRSEPGVAQVTYATQLPGTTFGQFRLEFATPEVATSAIPHSDGLWVRSAGVGPGYFETFDIPLIAGRLFTESEIEGNRPVAVVDETFVRLILGGRRAIGLMVREPQTQAGATAGPWHEIIGVVRDVTVRAGKKSYDGMLYHPAPIATASPGYLLVRTQGAPLSTHTLQATALAVTPDLRLTDVKSLDRAAADEALATRVFMRVFAVVAVIALLLSMAGIYALVSFTLARRTREIGIRVALGAAPHRIITSTFSRAFMQVAAGVVVGALPGAVLLMSGVEDSGGLKGAGAFVMLAVGAFVIAVAMLACAVPLRRALRIEPMQALRADE